MLNFYINKGKGLLRDHPKSIAKMKEKIKALTSRSNSWGNERHLIFPNMNKWKINFSKRRKNKF